MFSSIHSQKWLKWICSPKKYIVNVEIKINERYTFLDINVIAHNKSDAYKQAKEIALNTISIQMKGIKNIGKVKNINEF